MDYKCKFDPKRDIRATVPSLACDLESAIENGVVVDTGTAADYNDIEDVYNIRGRVRDAFDAVEAQRALLTSSKTAPSNTPSEPANVGEN